MAKKEGDLYGWSEEKTAKLADSFEATLLEYEEGK
jgi:hypothetical protein